MTEKHISCGGQPYESQFYCPHIMVLPSGEYQYIAIAVNNWGKMGEEVIRSPPESNHLVSRPHTTSTKKIIKICS